MLAERGLSCGAVMITLVILFPVTTSVAWTVPYWFTSAVPVYVVDPLPAEVTADGVAVVLAADDPAGVEFPDAGKPSATRPPGADACVSRSTAVAAGIAVAAATIMAGMSRAALLRVFTAVYPP